MSLKNSKMRRKGNYQMLLLLTLMLGLPAMAGGETMMMIRVITNGDDTYDEGVHTVFHSVLLLKHVKVGQFPFNPPAWHWFNSVKQTLCT